MSVISITLTVPSDPGGERRLDWDVEGEEGSVGKQGLSVVIR